MAVKTTGYYEGYTRYADYLQCKLLITSFASSLNAALNRLANENRRLGQVETKQFRLIDTISGKCSIHCMFTSGIRPNQAAVSMVCPPKGEMMLKIETGESNFPLSIQRSTVCFWFARQLLSFTIETIFHAKNNFPLFFVSTLCRHIFTTFTYKIVCFTDFSFSRC